MERKKIRWWSGTAILVVVLIIFTVLFWPRGEEPKATPDTVKAAPAVVAYHTLEWNVPLGRARAQTISVSESGSDTIPIPREFDILLTTGDSLFEYDALTPVDTSMCVGDFCKNLSGRYDWITFRSKKPGTITFWFEPHKP